MRFQVIDWQNAASIGVGRPQELITAQTLERFRSSLVLVVVIMAQRFGSPSGAAKSGTEEEIRWALAANSPSGFPEVKFFFRDISQLVFPPDLDEAAAALEQWKLVLAFREEVETGHKIWRKRYPDAASFGEVFRQDLDLWLHDEGRPWARHDAVRVVKDEPDRPPVEYLRSLVRDNQWLDIAGIDSDRAFKLPLEEIYVRLRVISAGPDGTGDNEDAAPFDIQTALERYRRLVVVGDPGSGKSTFLRFIALVLAGCLINGDPAQAHERLSLPAPIPVPIFVSCWDLAEHLRRVGGRGRLGVILEFIVERLTESGWPLALDGLRRLLAGGGCILLVDGLDEVPTEEGRHLVSDLIEQFVARHPGNRYVVTSRVRAYTGEAQLQEEFARCDIQPFAEPERKAFLTNWVGQLMKQRGDTADAGTELDALTTAIETSSIRELAINPLLLTVIAIVHWNRKRLPEQRVDLYDECIDVLLGQRKQAEQLRASRDLKVLEREVGERRSNQRVWVRKRFAEIAHAILTHSDEEIGHAAAVKLLVSHFRDKEDPRAAAERFLDEQELSSGLLVRRRSHSYRFVHLTFQEYLAAWHLASRVLTDTLDTITPHLRDPKWFETLQLLGGVLANRSDEDLDSYVGFLVGQAGATIGEQAPVVALCANIVRDTGAVATVEPGTRHRYEDLLRATLAAFAPGSGVPGKTQLEILTALGTLGASVKEHLISATRSGLLEVRRRALEMLVPHLSDADLFGMTHVLSDRSKEPIKTYINELADRDPIRAGETLLDLALFGEKTFDALVEVRSLPLRDYGTPAWPAFVGNGFGRIHARQKRAVQALEVFGDHRDETWTLLGRLAEQGSKAAVTALARWPARFDDTWELMCRLVEAGSTEALDVVVQTYGGSAVRELIERLARSGWEPAVSVFARGTGASKGGLEPLTALAERGSAAAIAALTQWRLYSSGGSAVLIRLAESGSKPAITALVMYREFYPEIHALLTRLVSAGSEPAIIGLARSEPENTKIRVLLRRLAGTGSAAAIECLNDIRPKSPQDLTVLTRLAKTGDAHAINALSRRRDSTGATDALLMQLARAGSLPAARALVQSRPFNPGTQKILLSLAARGYTDTLELLVSNDPGDAEAWTLIERADDETLRTVAPRLQYDDLDSGLATLGSRHGAPPPLLVRLIEAGSGAAGEVLLAHWPDDDETWQLLRRLPGAHAGPALWVALIETFGERPEVWEIVGRLTDDDVARIAQWRSTPAGLTRQSGNDAVRWAFLGRLAAAGSAEAGRLVAWRDWAYATAGETGVRAFFGWDAEQ
ncbi:NACHT domain-containing protein [Dactylosporangium sp. NPDC049742]|uniref:NACHT domain-containing protein n=1 Tax=Dactylosporangium sp. NPDC049742 TaxID=3154737 RepID=UPI003435B467